MDNNEDIINGAITAFINENNESKGYLKPKLISNANKNKVINSIKSELDSCDEFFISVAFITKGGLTPLLQDFQELESRGIKGKILTTDYLNFTEPEALKKLNEFSNIEVKLYSQEKHGFHTKAYIFRKGNLYKSIIGSSNLTLNALTINKEWNIGFTSLNEGEIYNSILSEFYELWNDSDDLDKVINYYEILYESNKKFEKIKEISRPKPIKTTSKEILPNIMQKNFLENIRRLIKGGENKCLLISATGTGKTYASAFAVKDFNPNKFLFIVHREQIAKQSIKAYKKIFNNQDKKFGLLTGNSKDCEADYLFSTIQTMSKEKNFSSYKPKEFDYIVIDEVHKAGALSYIKIMSHFKPKMWLGMTASPERTDHFDIYELFDHNIAHEIRLKEALEEDLLCPFHYFGITDIEINGAIAEDKFDNFNYLISKERTDYLIEKSEYYGFSGDRIKALVFCSRKDEAKLLSNEFNKKGYSTIALTGEDSQKMRENAIFRLTNDDINNKLDYIFTVDIFNEGVDIPEINQVLLVRPTQSPIIFVQQLGRGLRKFKNKEYLVVLDFIGNYNNNFMIPIALSGDRSYNKDNLRHFLMERNKLIPGSSSINFDKISKERIFNSINNTSFSKKSLYKEKYINLKFKIGKIPMLTDFYENGDLDPFLILDHGRIDNYHDFLDYVDTDYNGFLSENENNSLKFLSKWLSNGKRPHELIILKFLINKRFFTIKDIEEILYKDYNIQNDIESIVSAINFLKMDFITKKEHSKYENVSFLNDLNFFENSESLLKNNKFVISDKFDEFLTNNCFYNHINDLIDYSLLKYVDIYNNPVDGVNLSLYAKYSRKDICRILNWENDDSSTIYGYRIKYNTCPIFVTYDKHEDISSSTKYQDEFENNEIFSWMTRSNLNLNSKEVKEVIDYKKNSIGIHLFIKKSDDEGKEFYYIGPIKPIDHNQTTITNDDGIELPVVNFKFKLDNPIEEELYDYFVN